MAKNSSSTGAVGSSKSPTITTSGLSVACLMFLVVIAVSLGNSSASCTTSPIPSGTCKVSHTTSGPPYVAISGCVPVSCAIPFSSPSHGAPGYIFDLLEEDCDFNCKIQSPGATSGACVGDQCICTYC